MDKIAVYNQKGEKIGEEKLNSEIFNIIPKEEVIHQVVVSLLSNQRHAYAHTKTRAEVRGGGKKPWRQKGTGRARAGSNRSPIWIGGGIIFGPNKNRNFSKKINKKLKRKVLFMCFTDKVNGKKFYVIDDFKMIETKTKSFFQILNNLIPEYSKKKKNKKVLLSLPDLNIIRSSQNIENLKAVPITNLNILDCLNSEYLITSLQGLKKLEEHFKPQSV